MELAAKLVEKTIRLASATIEEILPALGPELQDSMLACRIRKNYRHVRKWAKRTQTSAFRIYDWEIGKYPLAIDFYAGRFCVQYFSRDREHPEPPAELEAEVEEALRALFGAQSDAIYWRSRIKRAKMQQYERADERGEFFPVLEYGTQFRVNLTDYLDTGLFLDHRETRRYVAAYSRGKRMLNLFAYTCSFSVQAAMQGAVFTKSVDMSNTYTEWGRENFLLNGFSARYHPIVRADCMKFLEEERERYDVIVIDPPTISRSKKMEQMFDVQIDYVFLIERSLKLLNPEGVIYFSTNSRKFVFDESVFPDCSILDVSSKTIPIDFHDPKIHRCWRIQFQRCLST